MEEGDVMAAEGKTINTDDVLRKLQFRIYSTANDADPTQLRELAEAFEILQRVSRGE